MPRTQRHFVRRVDSENSIYYRFSSFPLYVFLLHLWAPKCVRAPDKSINNSLSPRHHSSVQPTRERWCAIGRCDMAATKIQFSFSFDARVTAAHSFFVCTIICQCVCVCVCPAGMGCRCLWRVALPVSHIHVYLLSIFGCTCVCVHAPTLI